MLGNVDVKCEKVCVSLNSEMLRDKDQLSRKTMRKEAEERRAARQSTSVPDQPGY